MDIFNIISGLGILTLIVSVLGIVLFRHHTYLQDVLQRYGLWYIGIISGVATVGSLIYSNVFGLVPCPLCWYQRICMFPIPLLVAVALMRTSEKCSDIYAYLTPLALIGLLISAYQTLLQTGLFEQSLFCEPGSIESCSLAVVEVFNFISIPFMACVVFLNIVVISVIAKGRQ